MARKLRMKAGRKINAKRKTIVEPMFGQTKQERGPRRFLQRSLETTNRLLNLAEKQHIKKVPSCAGWREHSRCEQQAPGQRQQHAGPAPVCRESGRLSWVGSTFAPPADRNGPALLRL